MRTWWRWAPVVLALALLPAVCDAAIDEDDLLPVDEAFALAASAPEKDRLEFTWTIAKGYYLYRHRFDVQPTDSAFKARALRLPPGEKHSDEFFGQVETYRDRVTAVLPGAAADTAERVTLKIKYQGCADVGVCYPPQTRTLVVVLPKDGQGSDGGFAALGRRLGLGGAAPLTGTSPTGASEPLPLPPEQAFGFEAIADDGNTLLLRFTPAPGYYLYRDRTQLKLDTASGVALERPRWPKGVSHRDEHFGDVIVYFDRVDVPVPLRRTRSEAQAVTLTATFQGCQNDGICYPPMTRTVRVALPAGSANTGSTNADMAALTGATSAATTAAASSASKVGGNEGDRALVATAATPANTDVAAEVAPARSPAREPVQADDSRIASALAGKNRWWTLLGFFGAGLLLAFTPCVLPMIPILSGLIAGQGTRIGTRRALVLSLVYVVANALVFTVAGVVAGLVGANLQVAFQTPWVIIAFALLFVVLALSSFGLYELQLPAALRARLGSISDKQRGGSLLGVAAMGALSALIVGPCVAPPLAAAVLYIGQTHDPVLGGAALFLLAMGMGVPLLAFGAAAGRGMPTSGPWMTAAQRVFGFVFLALAVWMLSRILPGPAALGLYGLLALAAAAWAFSESGTSERPRIRGIARFAGLVLAVVGAAELLGALGGGRDPLQPLAGIAGGANEVRELPFRRIKSVADLDRELATAQTQGKPVLFDFYADWCVSCKEMEKYTFAVPAVHAALSDFVLLKADVTANDDLDQALMKRFGIIGPPATLYFTDGRERRELRLIGFEKAEDFVARSRKAIPANR